MKIEAVILYSSNDERFFRACVGNLLKIGIRCHVVTYSHMWNGCVESEEILTNSQTLFANNTLYNQYSVDWEEGQSPWYWEGLGRYLGTTQVLDDSDYILYVDIDEIADSTRLQQWIHSEDCGIHDSYKLATYWYWREPIYRSNNIEDSIVLLKTSIAKQMDICHTGRECYFMAGRSRVRMVEKRDPMFHHYSWVRTKDEMLNKVKNWGHASDRSDWTEKVNEEFSRPFNGKSFIGTTNNYEIVNNLFNI